MKIAIIGCGFAGLSASILLSSKHDVHIYEKFKKPEAVGAGILLQPSSWRVLQDLGIFNEVLRLGEKITYLEGVNHKNKKVFLTRYKDYDEKLFGIGILRSSVFELLYQKAISNHVAIKNDIFIDNLNDLKNEYDLVIIANGTKSHLREQLNIEQKCNDYPYGCIWTTIEDEIEFKGYLQQYVRGSKEMFGFLPSGLINDKRQISVFWSLPVKDRVIWENNQIKKQNVFESMKNHNLPSHIYEKIIHCNYSFAQYSNVWMKKYHENNVVIIGDAAHAMSPQLGQGANMAFIDAYCLNQCLAKEPNLQMALKFYTLNRKKHHTFYSQASRFLTPLFQSDSSVNGLIRDILFSRSQNINFSKKFSSEILCGNKQSWL